MLEVARRRRRARGRCCSAARRPPLRDVAELGHLRAAPRCGARGRRAGVEDRVVVGGRLRQAGEQRRLRAGQLPDRLREVDLARRPGPRPRCCLRPSRRRRCSGTGRGFRLASGASAYSIASFASMILRSRLRLRVRDAEVADQLLGDRRAALDRFAGFEVLDRGAQDRPRSRRRRARRSAGPRSRPSPAAGRFGIALDRDRGARFVGGDRRRACCRRRRRRPSCRPGRSACRWRARAPRRRRRAPRR